MFLINFLQAEICLIFICEQNDYFISFVIRTVFNFLVTWHSWKKKKMSRMSSTTTFFVLKALSFLFALINISYLPFDFMWDDDKKSNSKNFNLVYSFMSFSDTNSCNSLNDFLLFLIALATFEDKKML
jgi:hypothetical protein